MSETFNCQSFGSAVVNTHLCFVISERVPRVNATLLPELDKIEGNISAQPGLRGLSNLQLSIAGATIITR